MFHSAILALKALQVTGQIRRYLDDSFFSPEVFRLRKGYQKLT